MKSGPYAIVWNRFGVAACNTITVVTSRESKTNKTNNSCFMFTRSPIPMRYAPSRANEKMVAPCFPIYFFYITYKVFLGKMCLIKTLFWGLKTWDIGMDVLKLDEGLILGWTSQFFWMFISGYLFVNFAVRDLYLASWRSTNWRSRLALHSRNVWLASCRYFSPRE